jgi:hypothetical protein
MFRKLRDQTSSNADQKVPQENGAEESGDEIEAGGGHAVQVPANEAPQDDIDSHPGEQRHNACGASAEQVEVAQRDGCHAPPTHHFSGPPV